MQHADHTTLAAAHGMNLAPVHPSTPLRALVQSAPSRPPFPRPFPSDRRSPMQTHGHTPLHRNRSHTHATFRPIAAPSSWSPALPPTLNLYARALRLPRPPFHAVCFPRSGSHGIQSPLRQTGLDDVPCNVPTDFWQDAGISSQPVQETSLLRHASRLLSHCQYAHDLVTVDSRNAGRHNPPARSRSRDTPRTPPSPSRPAR